MFCLVADVEIRRRTNNRFGLKHALRAVLDAGGTLTETWEIERVLEIADRAVGVPVLSELFPTWKDKSVAPDLDRLWAELGVQARAAAVSLVDTRPARRRPSRHHRAADAADAARRPHARARGQPHRDRGAGQSPARAAQIYQRGRKARASLSPRLGAETIIAHPAPTRGRLRRRTCGEGGVQVGSAVTQTRAEVGPSAAGEYPGGPPRSRRRPSQLDVTAQNPARGGELPLLSCNMDCGDSLPRSPSVS